ncbi:MAG: hypothetical protein ACD_41C00197G0001 [uncultured bacterium]|nr:MAG: hypothetical protein ACD_41C00197G0001 [uncultured bacterium]
MAIADGIGNRGHRAVVVGHRREGIAPILVDGDRADVCDGVGAASSWIDGCVDAADREGGHGQTVVIHIAIVLQQAIGSRDGGSTTVFINCQAVVGGNRRAVRHDQAVKRRIDTVR